MKRVYLDTADLFAVAEGTVDGAVVTGLRNIIAERRAGLVLSRAHIQDISRAAAATRESFVRVVESFQPVLMVVEGPTDVEPHADDVRDIDASPCTNFRELVEHPASRVWLDRENREQDELHNAQTAAQSTWRRPPKARPVSKATLGLFLRCAITLLHGWQGDDVEPIVAYWEEKDASRLPRDQRTLMVSNLIAVKDVLLTFRAHAESAALDPRTLLQGIGPFGANTPGQSLMFAVNLQRGYSARRPLRSDSVDLEHITHFPYVDIATCDAFTHDATTKALRTIRCVRPVQLFRNNRLAEVLDALQ